MMVGFFMILVDATIVAVANPSIMEKLGADYDAVHLGDQRLPARPMRCRCCWPAASATGSGRRTSTWSGLAVFTAASLWCGLAGTIGMLIAARVVQGIGAALLTPQTLSTITRIFPPERRGVAMSVWGATAGVATLVGPLAGGVLVDRLGWQWIFFVNVPIGVIGLGLAFWLVPVLPTEKHGFDVLGVLLSGVGMFLIVFALQEGESHALGAVDLGHDRRRRRLHGRVRLLAGGQPRRAADPVAHLPRPRLQPVQRRRRGDRLRRHGDDRAGDVLRAGGVRAVPDPVGAADRADGDRVRRARPVGRQDRRPGAPAAGRSGSASRCWRSR